MPDSDSAGWADLPAAVREGIEQHAGRVTGAEAHGEGVSTSVRLILRTQGGSSVLRNGYLNDQTFTNLTAMPAGELSEFCGVLPISESTSLLSAVTLVVMRILTAAPVTTLLDRLV